MSVDFTKMTKKDVGKLFDFASLSKDLTEEQVRKGCRDAIKYNCKAFCYSSSYWTPVVKEELEGTDLLIGAGIGFPLGQQTSAVKAFEAEEAVKMGATVLDNCMNVGNMKEKKYDAIKSEFKDYVNAAGGVITKMIIECCMLTDGEIKIACELCAEAGINYVKSSTGHYAGPTLEQTVLMRDCLKGTGTKLKVSGVKAPKPQNAYVYLMAGAELIGTQDAPMIIDSLDLMREVGIVPKYQG